MKTFIIFIILIVIIVAAYLGYEFFRIRHLENVSSGIVARTQAYQSATGTFSILVLGDSTAVGVGASTPAQSVPGLLGTSLDASVENYAVSGAVTSQMEGQLAQAKKSHYDLVLIQVGANDVISFHSLDTVNAQLQQLLSQVQKLSPHIVVLTAGKIGDAPLIPVLFRGLVNARAAKLQSLFTASVAAIGGAYVNLSGLQSDVFATDEAKYYAADTFHPSSAGYALWFDALKAAIMTKWPGEVYGRE